MSVKRRKFQLGVRLKPTAEATTLEGELSANSSSLTFKAYIDGNNFVMYENLKYLNMRIITAIDFCFLKFLIVFN